LDGGWHQFAKGGVFLHAHPPLARYEDMIADYELGRVPIQR
jgi:hypothetical protein